jgi:RNA recognition motif-containing protein
MMDDYTGKSRGFGFVEMANAEDGEKAIIALNGTLLRTCIERESGAS